MHGTLSNTSSTRNTDLEDRGRCHDRPVPDRLFEEPRLAELYDACCAGRPDFALYLPLVMAAEAVLDVGCGTGELLRLAHAAGHQGRLCGLDPAPAMLAMARRCPGVEWRLGDLDGPEASCGTGEFDLVVMTGHAFQVLLDDEQIQRTLRAVRRALRPDGRLAFETRHPAARAWERWTPERATHVTNSDGRPVHVAHDVREVRGDRITFTTTYRCADWARDEVSWSTLRFLDPPALARHLTDAGLVVETQLGWWDGAPLTDTSEEIITIARPG
jgi:SAM-dependent methyltransferase